MLPGFVGNRTLWSINLKCLSNVSWALSLKILVQISKIKWAFVHMEICSIYQSQIHLQIRDLMRVTLSSSWGGGVGFFPVRRCPRRRRRQ